MPDSRTFTHIVFDLDHTLTFYPMTTAGVVAATFARLGLTLAEEVPVEDLASTYDKLWVSLERSAESADALRLAVWRRLLAERGLPDDNLAGRIAVEYGAIRRANGVQLFDGARQLLLDLRTAGYGLGLLTNGLSDVQWEKIRSLGLEASFDSILVAGDVGVFKPDRRVFAMLLDRLAALASRTLFVGDSYEMDVVGASAAGLETAWIRPLGAPLPGRVVPGFAFPSIQGLRGVVL